MAFLKSAILFTAVSALLPLNAFAATEIIIGNTAGYSVGGAAAATPPKVMTAYFQDANDRNLLKQKIKFLTWDDSFSPPKALEQVKKLVEKESAVFLVGIGGSAINLAISGYLKEKKVPDLFFMSGLKEWSDKKEKPYSLSLTMPVDIEARAVVKRVLAKVQNPKIAVLYLNDAIGKEFLAGVREALGDKKDLLVGSESYESTDPKQDSQILKLKSTGANVFLNFSTGKALQQTIKKAKEIGWTPLQYITPVNRGKKVLEPAGLDNCKGLISFGTVESSYDLKKDDPAFVEYARVVKKYAPDVDPNDDGAIYGSVIADLTLKALKAANGDYSADGIMKAARSLHHVTVPFVKKGIVISTDRPELGIYSAVDPVVFDGNRWQGDGELIDVTKAK